MNIVGIGGGTGLPVLLRGLKELSDAGEVVHTTAIVCVSDDGGSSGLLRQAFGIPAVGDLRNCMVALAGGNPSLREIFQYRLRSDFGLDGHTIGNLIVAALSARAGNLRRAVQLASEILDLRGRVLPATEISATLCAEFADGDTACGETRIAARGKRIRRVWLDPQQGDRLDVPAAPGVVEAIRSADAIVLGPGSLYTSVIPCLLPSGIAAAVRDSAALKILVCNLMTQPGETDGYSAADHVASLLKYLGPSAVQICLLNSSALPGTVAGMYAASGAEPVREAPERIRELGVMPIALDLLDSSEAEARHDPAKLARWIAALTRAFERAREMHQLPCYAVGAAPALAGSVD